MPHQRLTLDFPTVPSDAGPPPDGIKCAPEGETGLTQTRLKKLLRYKRGDRDGAPYRFFGGVKYRPRSRYEQFILNSIREGKPRAPKRKQRSTQRADRAIQK